MKDERVISISIDDENDFKVVQEFLVDNIEYINNLKIKKSNQYHKSIKFDDFENFIKFHK